MNAPRAPGPRGGPPDAEHLLPVLEATAPADVFADPFADPYADGATTERRPVLVLLDDGADEPAAQHTRARLVETAEARGVRVETLSCSAGSADGDVARYAALLATGTYAAAYLRVGLDA